MILNLKNVNTCLDLFMIAVWIEVFKYSYDTTKYVHTHLFPLCWYSNFSVSALQTKIICTAHLYLSMHVFESSTMVLHKRKLFYTKLSNSSIYVVFNGDLVAVKFF